MGTRNPARPSRRAGADHTSSQGSTDERRARHALRTTARTHQRHGGRHRGIGDPRLASTEPAIGSFTEGPETITSEQFADGNEIYTLTRQAVFSGTYDGVGQAEQRIVIHKDGSANLQMTIAFTGLACGQPAILTFNVSGTADFVTNTFTGHYAIVGGQAGGDTLRGHGTFSGTPGTGGIYDGSVNCD